MSVEKQVRRELRRVAFWRALSVLVASPGYILGWVASGFNRIADIFSDLADVVFMFELEAARRYRALTGVDLGYAVKGDIHRYSGMNPKALAQAESEFGEDVDDDD